MFNISAYLGAMIGGIGGAIICWLALFTPGTLLIFACLPFWNKFRKFEVIIAIMDGVNAGAIGLIATAVYMLWVRIVLSPYDAAIVILLFSASWIFSVKAPFVVLISGILGFLLSLIGI